MKRRSYAKSRDANEPEIIEALKKAGAKVQRLDMLDLLVQFEGKLYLLEVKTEKGKNTDAQNKLKEKGWIFHIVRTPLEALKAIGAI